MMWLLLAGATLLALACRRMALPVWSAAFAFLILLGAVSGSISGLPVITLWLVFFLIVVPLNITGIRRKLFTGRIMPLLKRALPPMSQTERDALEAGTVWWEGELFGGRPDWNKMLALPTPRLSEAEQAFLDGPVEELCRMLDDWHITEERHDLPPQVWQFIKDKGFFGMIIPRSYGGLEFSALAHSSVVMKIATRSVSAAVTVMVPNSLGPAELLLHYGTDAQKQYYLPRLAQGLEVPCFALTGPEAGSDAASIPDRGVVCRGLFEGREVLGIRLNWDKRYITLGPVATVLGLAFRLYDPDHLLGEKEDIGITCALIPTSTPGVWIGHRHAPLNMVFMNGPNRGKDVFIPLDWVIGGPARVGQGWRMLMECLAAGRSISLPALATGAGKLVSRATGAYARIRKQFKMPIGRFEGVEEPLARMAGHTYVMDAARTMTAGAIDLGEKPSVVSAIVKYNLTERMRKVVNDAMDVQGGSAICMGRRNYLARIYQSIPISITVEGANILTRTLIIFGQGAVRSHPYVLKEMQAAAAGDLEAFDAALMGHLGFAASNAAATLWLGLSGGRWSAAPVAGPEQYFYRQLNRVSAAFAFVSDVAMLSLGGELKRREKISGRLADILSQLYLASAALKRFQDQGRPPEDWPLLQWGCQEALYTIQGALDGLLRNLPLPRSVLWLLRCWVFPLGRPYRPPSDRLGHQVATLLLAPSAARDRLTAGVFVARGEDEPLGRLEHTLPLVIAAEAVEKKLRDAVARGQLQKAGDEALLAQGLEKGVIGEADKEMLHAATAARRDVIQVDDFPPQYWHKEAQHDT